MGKTWNLYSAFEFRKKLKRIKFSQVYSHIYSEDFMLMEKRCRCRIRLSSSMQWIASHCNETSNPLEYKCAYTDFVGRSKYTIILSGWSYSYATTWLLPLWRNSSSSNTMSPGEWRAFAARSAIQPLQHGQSLLIKILSMFSELISLWKFTRGVQI